MRKLNNKVVDKKIFTCPQCLKHRMLRPVGHVVSLEKTEFKSRENVDVSLLTDVCDNCLARNYRSYFEPTKADVRKVLSGIPTDENVSLEELL